MSDVVVSVTESTTVVSTTNNVVNVAVTETPVVVSTSTAGLQGASGANGTGVPVGGTAGQVLAKIDGTNYNTQWVNAASGTPVYALTAGTASFATASGSATSASTALTAGTAYFATTATSATSATSASTALTAGTASYATLAGTAVNLSGTVVPSQVSWTSITDWMPSTYYNTGDLVNYLGVAYRRATAGTSMGTFVVTNWNQITPANSAFIITKSQVSDFTSGTVAYATSATSASTALTAGTAYFATTAGTATYSTTSGTATFATTAGTATTISGSITRSQVSDYAGGTVAHGTADPFLIGDNAFTGQNTFTPTNASSTALRVVGQPSQGAILQDWRSSSASLVSIAADGALSLPNASVTASGVATFNSTTVTATGTASKALIVNAPTGMSANLQEWQVNGAALARISPTGQIATSGNLSVGSNSIVGTNQLQVTSASAANTGALIKGAANQLADIMQIQNSSATVLGGRNANAQIYTGSTAGLTTAVGGATTSASSTTGTATVTTTSAHNLAAGDLIVVAGITPVGFNGTYVVSAVPSSTAVSYVNATAGPQSVAGTISTYAQTSIISRSAATAGLIVRGAASQVTDLQQWQNNTGAGIAYIDKNGGVNGSFLQLTGGAQIQMGAENSGGFMRLTKQSSSAAVPGNASQLKLYVVAGTNANTLKLVVRAGTAGTETTILDNITT